MTQLEEKAIEILKSYGDPACYEQMVQNIRRDKADVLVAEKEGVMLRSRCEGFYMLAGSEQGISSLIDRIPAGAQDVVIHGTMPDWVIEKAKMVHGLTHVDPFVLYAYYEELPPEETETEIRVLGKESLDFVYENYGHGSRPYIESRIADGVMIGAYVDGQLAAFIGEHAEGAMGLLHVMPDYRRHHLGYKLELEAIRRTMLRGYTPFCQVFLDNEASHRLQSRLRMTRSDGSVYWMSACAE